MRPLLSTRGGDYCQNLSSVLHVSLFTSFHLKHILCLLSMCRKKVTFLFALCVICQSVKTLTNMPDNTNRMLHHVSTLYHSVVRHVLAVNLILDIIGCVGCRVKCRLQNVNWLETMRARSELEESFAALWLPLGCFRAPSVGKPATLAYQLLELYCSLWTKHSVSAIRQSKPF